MINPSRHRIAAESGISLVEVLIAAVILTLTALAIATLSTGATHGTYRAEQDQVVVNRLQNELEHIRQLPFNQVALSGRPLSSTQLNDPGQRVSANGTQFDLNRNGTNTKPLAYAGGTTPEGNAVGCGASGQPACGVNPGPEPFQSGDVRLMTPGCAMAPGGYWGNHRGSGSLSKLAEAGRTTGRRRTSWIVSRTSSRLASHEPTGPR